MDGPIITPSTCSAHRYRLTIWCDACRTGTQVTNWDQRHWRAHWDEEIAALWIKPGMRCRKCRRPAWKLDVQRESQLGGQFATLLTLVRPEIPILGTIGDDGVVMPGEPLD